MKRNVMLQPIVASASITPSGCLNSVWAAATPPVTNGLVLAFDGVSTADCDELVSAYVPNANITIFAVVRRDPQTTGAGTSLRPIISAGGPARFSLSLSCSRCQQCDPDRLQRRGRLGRVCSACERTV